MTQEPIWVEIFLQETKPRKPRLSHMERTLVLLLRWQRDHQTQARGDQVWNTGLESLGCPRPAVLAGLGPWVPDMYILPRRDKGFRDRDTARSGTVGIMEPLCSSVCISKWRQVNLLLYGDN